METILLEEKELMRCSEANEKPRVERGSEVRARLTRASMKDAFSSKQVCVKRSNIELRPPFDGRVKR